MNTLPSPLPVPLLLLLLLVLQIPTPILITITITITTAINSAIPIPITVPIPITTSNKQSKLRRSGSCAHEGLRSTSSLGLGFVDPIAEELRVSHQCISLNPKPFPQTIGLYILHFTVWG